MNTVEKLSFKAILLMKSLHLQRGLFLKGPTFIMKNMHLQRGVP